MAGPDLNVFERNKSFSDYDRLNKEFLMRKQNAAMQAQALQQQNELKQMQMQQAQEERIARQKAESQPQFKVVGNSLLRMDPATGAVEPVFTSQTQQPQNSVIDVVNPEMPQLALKKLSATEQKDFSAQENALKDLENAIGALQQIKDYQGKPMYSGFGAEAISNANTVPVIGSFVNDEKAANTRGYQNLVKQGQFSQLKATFPGQISNAERTALESLGALATYTPEQQREILQNAEAALIRNRDLTAKRAQDIVTGNQYTKAATRNANEPLVVKTQAEFDALPSGAVYMEDDGKTYRKP